MSRNFATTVLVTEEEITGMLSQISQEQGDNLRIASSNFFARFGLQHLIRAEQFFQALDRGEEILHLCHRLNQDLYAKMHKGLMFYFMGVAAYRIHAYASAIYYIDSAVSEDLKNEPDNYNSPSRLFLRLEGEKDEQAAKAVVQDAQQRIEKLTSHYNDLVDASTSKNLKLSIAEIRKYLLEPASSLNQPDLRSLATAFITFFLEFDYLFFQLMVRKEAGTNEPFFTHLFKGCLLFESLLKKNPTTPFKGNTLEQLLSSLSNPLGIPKQVKINAAKLESVLTEVQSVDGSFASAITTTGKLRNTLGHNIGWIDQLTKEQYLQAFLSIAVSCLHTISTLYRTDE
jgi:hypothetical protein